MRTLFWREVNGSSTERLTIDTKPTQLTINSRVHNISKGGQLYELHYHIQCDANWEVQECNLQIGYRRLSLRAASHGDWRNDEGSILPHFAGSYDIDISATPFTNTLPIRRLNLPATAEPLTISIIYIRVPELVLEPQLQRYTWLRKEGNNGWVLYENLTSGYSAHLLVDNEGFILSYPDRFVRTITA